jgi:hypothetical protein
MWMLPPLELDGFKPSRLRPRAVHTSVFPFTHHRVRLQVYRRRAHQTDRRVQRWFHKEELDAVPIPSPHRRAINALMV